MFIIEYFLLILFSVIASAVVSFGIVSGHVFKLYRKGNKVDLNAFRDLAAKHTKKLVITSYIPGVNILFTAINAFRQLHAMKKDPDYKKAVRKMNCFDQEYYSECETFTEKLGFIVSFVDEDKKYSYLNPKEIKEEDAVVYKLKEQYNLSRVLSIDENAIIGDLNGCPTAIVNADDLEEIKETLPSFIKTKESLDIKYDVISLREFDLQDLGNKLSNIAYFTCHKSEEELINEFMSQVINIYGQAFYEDDSVKKKKTL